MVTDPSRHILLSDADGEPLDQNKDPFTPQEFDKYVERIIAHIQATVPINDQGKKQILIHIHGGLNTLESSRKRVVGLAPEIKKGGYYPILFGWRSGAKISYLEHLFVVRQGRKRPVRAILSSPFVFIADLGRGLIRAPIVVYRQAAIAAKTTLLNLDNDSHNADALFAVLRQKYVDENPPTDSDYKPEIRVSEGEDRRNWLDRWTKAARYVALFPFKIVTSILIDGFGTAAWDNMLRRTKVVFRTPSEFDIEGRPSNRQSVEKALSSPATGAISRLFDKLTNHMKSRESENPFDSEYEITLVGHSMGAIIMNHIVRKFPDLPYKRIVYMGAACSIREFEQNVVPYLKKHRETDFYNLCLHPVAEAREMPWILDFFPRGSLLEWIDSMFETPQTLMDRTLGKWDNVMQATHVIPHEIRDQVTIKSFGVGGDQGKPQRHGDFNDLAFWTDEVLDAERPPLDPSTQESQPAETSPDPTPSVVA